MSGPAELGQKSAYPQADLLSAAPERRPLCRVGAATTVLRTRCVSQFRSVAMIGALFGIDRAIVDPH